MITIKDFYARVEKRYRDLNAQEVASFDHYFNLSHSISVLTGGWYNIDHDIRVSFYLRIKDTVIVLYDVEVGANEIRERISYHLNNDIFENVLGYALADYIINNKNNIKDDIEKHFNEFHRYMKNKYKKSFKDGLDNLSKEAEEKDLTGDLEPIHVLPILTRIRGEYYLSLKVGRKKYYTITSIDSFVNKFANGTYHKYGKDLAFKHTINALDEQSGKFIGSLINSRFYLSGRYATVNKNVLSYLFESYQGKEVYIVDEKEEISDENNKYLIRLNPCDLYIRIDKHYVLTIESNDKDFYFFADKYVAYKDQKVVDAISENEIYGSLISQVFYSPYPCIEDNVDDFKYNFVLRFPNRFIIDEAVKDEFIFDALSIKAYFDFDGKIINLFEEIYLENKLVKLEDLSYRLAAQYRKYRAIIASLGFIDNLLKDPSKIIEFLSSSLDTLKQYCEVYLSENILNKTISKFVPPNLRISYNSSMLDVLMEESEYEDEELFAIIDGLRKKKKYILYKDQIINLDNEESERFIENVEEFHLVDKTKKNKDSKLPIYYAFKALDDRNGISLNEQILAIFDEIKHFKDNPFTGGNINGELRGYQLEGVKWLDILYRNYLNGILADDMGLGKTIEIISFLKGEKIKGNVLIVAPKSLVFNWKNEFQKFDPSAKVVSIYGTAKEREDIIFDIQNHKETIYFTSYDSFRRDEENYKDIKFDTVILDEAQYIKNARAKKTVALTHLNSDHRFVLTGTPIENSILDLWSIFNFLMPDYLPGESEFRAAYERDPAYATKIRNYVSPFILRRNKRDVLKDLPDKYELIISSEMMSEQRKIYDGYILLAKQSLEEAPHRAFDVLPIMTRLRQICIHPSLFLDNYTGGSGKLDSLKEIIDERIDGGHRILIFSQFVTALEMVRDILVSKDLQYFMITGDTKAEERVRIANEFNSSKRIKVGLVSLKAGGTGLNLVGADVVIHLDPWWNIAAQDQATDRAHRIGQERNVEVIKLIAENSIEEKVVELQNIKKDLVGKIIADDDSLITSLSLEDIQFILR